MKYRFPTRPGATFGEMPTVVLSDRSSEGKAMIEVADNGPGIPQHIRSAFFEPLVTRGKSNGTGLGLAITLQIVEAHGSPLSFASSPEGTAFTFKLLQPDAKSMVSALPAAHGLLECRSDFCQSSL